MIVEQCVLYAKELSNLVARDASGNMAFYPVIEAIAKPGDQVLDCALLPARISMSQSSKVLQLVANIVTKLPGMLASISCLRAVKRALSDSVMQKAERISSGN